MLNRIRVVTMLMMVLVIFALLQLISGGLFFSSLKQNQDSFAASNDLRLQQSELTSTWDLMLQTRINLSRSSARMMMDPNNQQSSAKTDLLKNARATLADAAKHYEAFKKITPQPAMEQVSQNIDEKYNAYHAGLAELIQFLESGNMDAYFAQPTQGMQNALGAALGEYAKVSGDLYHSAFAESQNDYRFAKWQMAVLALALVMYLRDHRLPLPGGMILMSPWADLTCGGESYDSNYELDPLFGNTRESMLYDSPYIGEEDPKNPYLSPVFGNFRGLPPMLFQVGSLEMLLSDSLTAAEKAGKAGVRRRISVYEGMFHVFQMSMDLFPESREAWAEAGRFLQIIYHIRVKPDGVVVRKVKPRSGLRGFFQRLWADMEAEGDARAGAGKTEGGPVHTRGGKKVGSGGEMAVGGGKTFGNGGETAGSGGKRAGNSGNKAGNGGKKAVGGGKKAGSGGEKAGNGGNKAVGGGKTAGNGGEKAGNGGKKAVGGGKTAVGGPKTRSACAMSAMRATRA